MLCGSSADGCDVCQCSRMLKSNSFFSRDCEQCENKENVDAVAKGGDADVSLYEETPSPTRVSCLGETSPSHCRHHFSMHPLEEHDGNSQDSGYYPGERTKSITFGSPLRSGASSNALSSFKSECSLEDEFLDILDLEPREEDALPRDFGKLISGSLAAMQREAAAKGTPPRDSLARPLFRRALSLQAAGTASDGTPNSSRVRFSLFAAKNDGERAFKRPEPPCEEAASPQNKRSRVFPAAKPPPCRRPFLQRGLSMPAFDSTIEVALQRSTSEPDLIGDFTKTFCLPLTAGRHSDLKSITPATLVALMSGGFDAKVASFKVIDCRYPYEFEGGHISGAVNIFTKDQCAGLLDAACDPKPDDGAGRHILVFHCEFSSERGPSLSRFLRNLDRKANDYPALTYPEVYLLDGGYKSFYERHPEHCTPRAYKTMNDPNHKDELRRFRSKSRSWCSGARGAIQQ